MKLTKSSKILALVLCAALLVGGSVMATVAYLQDSEEVVNTFTVGKVDITLDETAVNADGTEIPGATRVKQNAYHLIPGQTYVKDPTMTVIKGSEESYVRMIVTLNKAKELKEVFGTGFLPQNYVEGWDSAVWTIDGVNGVKEDTAANTLTYEFRYATTVKPAANTDLVLDALFDNFTLPTELNGEDLEKLTGFEITVNGHAIQAVGFEADTANSLAAVDVAWNAFDAQYAKEHPTTPQP